MRCSNLKRIAFSCVMILLTASLPGCASGTAVANATEDAAATAVLANQFTVEYDQEDLDTSWDSTAAVEITFAGQSASAGDASDGVSISDGTVTITKAGTYKLSGSLSDGQVIVDAGKEATVRLVLSGVSLSCSNSSPLYIKQADKTIITLDANTENTLVDGSVYAYADETEDEPDAALFSKDDLTINGSGSLTITGNYNNGITSKDDLIITGGILNVTSVGDGIRGKDSVAVKDGTITVQAGQDGIKSNNDTDAKKGWISLDGGTFHITAVNDGIQAETVLQANDGAVTITTGEGSSSEETKVNTQKNMGGFGGHGGFGGTDGSGGRMEHPNHAGMGNEDQASSTSGLMKTFRSDGAGANRSTSNAEMQTPPQPPADMAASTSSGAAVETESESAKALKAGTCILINGGDFTIDSFDDSIHSNGSAAVISGTLNLYTGDDGIHADDTLLLNGGTIDITQSYEGLEGAVVLLNDGEIHLTATDDGVNAAGDDGSSTSPQAIQDTFASNDSNRIQINGGTLVVNAGGDGLDSNGDLTINGGTVLINGPTSGGDGSLDCNGTLTVNGGLLIASGSMGMVQVPDQISSQAAVMIQYTEPQKSGTLAQLASADGKTQIVFAPAKDYQTLIISSPDLKQGQTYQLSSGGSSTKTNVDGLYTDGSCSGGTSLTEITLASQITKITDSGEEVTGGMGGPGGHGGGERPAFPESSEGAE